MSNNSDPGERLDANLLRDVLVILSEDETARDLASVPPV